MKFVDRPHTLYETRLAQQSRDGYIPWLMEFRYACVRLTGTDSIYALDLAQPLRRWFLAGKTPVEAVRLSRQRYVRGRRSTAQ